ncbi:hypothetical protein GCM10022279_16660 [Comamonas faecalis]|uniref:Uncharacterized protein n=2 Tax=Comamonas faecalis TaxID=1387849 RepID=A0ABP7R866_9BURK
MFDDTQNRRWQAALLEASYGQVLLIFSPEHGSGFRQHLMQAEYLAQAQEQLDAADDAALAAWLAEADPWEPA